MADITTREGRERERVLLEQLFDEGCPYAETDDCRCRYMEMSRRALNGLDIAQEMREALKLAVHKAEQIRDGQCNPNARARAVIQVATEALAKWEKWAP